MKNLNTIPRPGIREKRFDKMTIFLILILFNAFILLSAFKSVLPKNNLKKEIKRERAFDDGWKFKRDSTIDGSTVNFSDAKWRTVDLPHDFSVEDLPAGETPEQIGGFSKSSKGSQVAGFGVGGTGWYRRHFIIAKEDKGKIVKVVFEAVMMQSDVWLNGRHLGDHSYGYSPFEYDLTPYLNPPGQDNVIAVRAKNDIGSSSRWFSGAGINRNVKLLITDPIHVAQYGVHIQTTNVSRRNASITLDVKVTNEHTEKSSVQVMTEIVDPDGKTVAADNNKLTISGSTSGEYERVFQVNNPLLWDTESPHLYKAKIKVTKNRVLIDSYEQIFGIREIKWSVEKGLTLNGNVVKLRGGCLHSDNGILGTAAFQRAEERRVAIMKANGFNAIRSSHNQPSKYFLDACDRLGVLVVDEAFDVFTKPKTPTDYHLYFKSDWKRDFDAEILSDRNHPSVIMWSMGNEIRERADSTGLAVTKMLVNELKTMDVTRPTTEAVNSFVFDKPSHPWSYSAPLFAELDIAAYNYGWDEWDNDHKLYPNRIMMESESYPIDMYAVWARIDKTPYEIGDFVWTGMDYMGEAGVGAALYDNEATQFAMQFGKVGGSMHKWPWYNGWCGDIDVLGFKKPQSYYRDIIWNRSKIEIAVHDPIPEGQKELITAWGWPNESHSWTWPGQEGKTMQVNVYTRCSSVRLYLNGKLIDEQKVSDDLKLQKKGTPIGFPRPSLQLCATFKVPYEAGELKAVGVTDGREVAKQVIHSYGAPKKLVLKAERTTVKADRNDLAYIKVSVADAKGNLLSHQKLQVSFKLSGDGSLAAAGNSGPEVASFQQNHFLTYDGNGMIIVRPYKKTGTIIVTVTAEGLAPATTVVHVQ